MENEYHINKMYFNEPLEFGDISIIQIGRLFCKPGGIISPHMQTNLFELTVITDGEGAVYANGVPTPVKRGDIFLSMPGDVHAIESDKQHPLKYDFLAFSAKSFFKQLFDEITAEYHSPLSRVFNDDRILPLLSNAILELNESDAHSPKLLESIFVQILIYTVRSFEQNKQSASTDNTSYADRLCYKIMNYIDTHLYSLKNLDELADIMGYSYGYISTLFKRTTSTTLSDYFFNKKLHAARMLIAENKLNITEIAELLNYSSVFAFSKAFTKKFGISPRAYKNGTEC